MSQGMCKQSSTGKFRGGLNEIVNLSGKSEGEIVAMLDNDKNGDVTEAEIRMFLVKNSLVPYRQGMRKTGSETVLWSKALVPHAGEEGTNIIVDPWRKLIIEIAKLIMKICDDCDCCDF